MKNIRYLIILISFLFVQCSVEDNAIDIDMNINGVTDSVYSVGNQVFYILNSDYDNSYKTGSILVVSKEGKKLFAQETPRMGRVLKQVGNTLLVLFEGSDDEDGAGVRIYDIEQDASLKLKKSWDGKIDCSPNALAAVDSYEYYAVSCGDGSLFVGDVEGNFFNKVRNYKTSHRGIFIDKNSGLVFSFPSSASDSRYIKDLTNKDVCSYSEASNSCDPSLGSNEVPDEYETNKIVLNRYKEFVRRYQVGIYSISGELSKPQDQRFMFEEIDQDRAKTELKYIYELKENGEKTYKTGFWYAVGSNEDNSIYISRRVSGTGEILKVSVNKSSVDEGDKLSDILSLETIQSSSSIEASSGFNSNSFFPGKLVLVKLGGKNYLVANHFKDFVYFPNKDARLFGYSMFDLEQKKSVKGIISKNVHSSYYSLSVDEEGQGLSGAFYGNKLIPLTFKADGIVSGWNNLDSIY